MSVTNIGRNFSVITGRVPEWARKSGLFPNETFEAVVYRDKDETSLVFRTAEGGPVVEKISLSASDTRALAAQLRAAADLADRHDEFTNMNRPAAWSHTHQMLCEINFGIVGNIDTKKCMQIFIMLKSISDGADKNAIPLTPDFARGIAGSITTISPRPFVA